MKRQRTPDPDDEARDEKKIKLEPDDALQLLLSAAPDPPNIHAPAELTAPMTTTGPATSLALPAPSRQSTATLPPSPPQPFGAPAVAPAPQPELALPSIPAEFDLSVMLQNALGSIDDTFGKVADPEPAKSGQEQAREAANGSASMLKAKFDENIASIGRSLALPQLDSLVSPACAGWLNLFVALAFNQLTRVARPYQCCSISRRVQDTRYGAI